MKKKLLTCIIALIMLIPATSALAETTEETVNVNGGGLTASQSVIHFTDVNLSVRQNQTSVGTSQLLVNDSRGTGVGWSAGVSATDFVLTKDINGTLVDFIIPISAVSYTAQLDSIISGSPIPFGAGNNFLATNQVMSNSTTSIAKADVGQGMGAYVFGLKYTLSVPKTIMTSEGAQVGVLEGTYKSTFTFTVVSGI